MRLDVFGIAKKRAEQQILKLEDQNYSDIDLSDLIYHWASMSSQVPATVDSLLSFNNFAIVSPGSREVIRETVLAKAKGAMREIYGNDFDLQVIEPLGRVLWKHGSSIDKKRTDYMISEHGIPADID